ncbi:MAG: hypothetical protein EP346_03475 [Bacteroidetes bacterium]|nr:MAG: hypothetical protein EP346_03475 [Bacteroidota bacterium]
MKKILGLLILASAMVACNGSNSSSETDGHSGATAVSYIHYPQEKHLANVRQLTWGGDNAEAYFSFDGTMLTFQSNNSAWGLECDHIFAFDWNSDSATLTKPTRISSGLGRTTCAYFLPGDTTILYASTFAGDSACPPVPDRSEGYVWPVYNTFDIYVSNLKGEVIDTLVEGPGYDAEATVSPMGDKIVFTSDRSGDLELYTCDIDGSNVQQITSGLGYDGGAFFSPDGKKLIFRSSRPKTEAEIEHYTSLLKQGLVEPMEMELYTCNVDGTELTKITDLGRANWAPFFHPSGEKVIFSSNHSSDKVYKFNLFMLDLNTDEVEQITYDGVFDAFPMFSPDGKKLVFASNRNNGGDHSTNLFIADWVE